MLSKTPKETIDAIVEVRDRYSSICEEIDQDIHQESGNNHLFELMSVRKELSCIAMDLAIKTGEHLRKFKDASAIVYTKRYLKQKELMAAGEKVTAAESKSKQHVTQEVKNEYEHEADYMSYRIILNQTNELLASVKQDISIIKKDYDSSGDRE